jgi:ankyrin repeat protein
VNAETTFGASVLDAALSKKHEELINLIKASGGSSNADQSIHVASFIGDLQAVKKHLDAGSDVNAKDNLGATPMNYVASGGHREIAELLLGKGADVNAKDNQSGNTPLHTAARYGRKEIGELLTEHR